MKSPNVWCFESPFTDGMPYAPHWTQWRSHRNPCPASRRCSSRSGSPTGGTWIVAMVILRNIIIIIIIIIIVISITIITLCLLIFIMLL